MYTAIELKGNTIPTYGNRFYDRYKRCTSCGQKYSKDVKNCKDCGYRLRTKAHNSPFRNRDLPRIE